MPTSTANVLGVRGAVLSILVNFFDDRPWESPVEMGVKAQRLTPEDKLFILTQAGTVPNSHARSGRAGATDLLRARRSLVSLAWSSASSPQSQAQQGQSARSSLQFSEGFHAFSPNSRPQPDSLKHYF
jgi:hypothetical protein